MARSMISLSYFLIIAWLLLLVAFSIPVIIWFMLNSVCSHETAHWHSISAFKEETDFLFTFNLTNYGLYHHSLDLSLYSESVNSPTAFASLCQEISNIGPLYACALLSTGLVLLGLFCSISCLANSAERFDYFAQLSEVRRQLETKSHQANSQVDEYALRPLVAGPGTVPTGAGTVDGAYRFDMLNSGGTHHRHQPSERESLLLLPPTDHHRQHAYYTSQHPPGSYYLHPHLQHPQSVISAGDPVHRSNLDLTSSNANSMAYQFQSLPGSRQLN